jgi:hypothetical protein
MKRYTLYLILVFCTAVTAVAEDTIVFKNGDVLTGQILRQDDTSIRFSSSSLGELNLDHSDISEIISPPTKSAENVGLPEPNESTNAPALEIATAESIEKAAAEEEVKSQWSGQAGLSIAMRQIEDYNVTGTRKDDKFKTYRVYGHVNWQGERNSLNWNWTYRYSEDENRIRDDFLNLTQKYNRDFSKVYYGEAKTVYQQDYNRSIDNEFLQTAEVGRRWLDTPKVRFSTSIGGGYHVYEQSLSAQSVSVSEPKFVFDESLEVDMIRTLTLFQSYTHLGDTDRYHFIFRTGLENNLIRDLFLRFEYRVDRDTDTIYDGRDYRDEALLTSLLYKF